MWQEGTEITPLQAPIWSFFRHVSVYSSQTCIDQEGIFLSLEESKGSYLRGQGHVETPREVQESSLLCKIILPMH